MNATQLLERARAVSLNIEAEGNALRLRAPEPPPEDLLEDIATYKRTLLVYLRAEADRQTAVDNAWNKLQRVHLRFGCPDGWLTEQVRRAESSVDFWWLKARENPAYNNIAIEAIETWVGVAVAFIVATASVEQVATVKAQKAQETE